MLGGGDLRGARRDQESLTRCRALFVQGAVDLAGDVAFEQPLPAVGRWVEGGSSALLVRDEAGAGFLHRGDDRL